MMEYDEPEELVAADNARFSGLMLKMSISEPGNMALIAGQLSRAYKSGRSQGRNEGFANGFACGVPLP